MSSLPFTDDYIKKSCKAYRKSKQGGATKRNFHVLKDGAGKETDYAVKMAHGYGTPGLRHERDCMLHLSTYVDPKKVVIPKGYTFIQDGDWGLLVVQNIPGKTMWELMDDGNEELSPNDANDIANAIQELRNVVQQPSDEALTPSAILWNIKGHIFKPDNDGGRALQTKKEFEDFMDDRLTKVTGTTSRLPDAGYVFTHGDLSPHNIKRLPDGRLAILDYDMSFFAPTYWEPYALYALCYIGISSTNLEFVLIEI
ncbi:hypothetical protein FIBSPDRAFT_1047131 [Athelia psychrophila]|uniref:Aminoglycoside phosphotransferase domain-containing protein n=1 Tax=Athelia psychrophila TaxID=1759441 RepID=A0A166FP84_9AGAM|nr:hypothetical protein FIBSPDRAFT_1047131 [Fibularhizoctonia sp. CBS 109695]